MQEEIREKKMKIGNNVTEIEGIVLKVKNKFVCWNSFKSEFYLGDEAHSEIFPWNSKNDRLEKALKAFPNAKQFDIGD